MAFLDTKYKRKSAFYTTLIGILLLIVMFVFGLTYFDPPIEYGIAVNFGTSDVGSGNVQPNEALKPAAASESESEPVEEVEEVVEEEVMEEEVVPETEEVTDSESEEASSPSESEKLMTQESAEALNIKKAEEERKLREARQKEEARKEEARKKAEAEEERQRKIREENERKERERKEQEAKRKSVDALMGGFSDGNGKAEGGEGDDNQPGDKGKETGDPNARGYYGIVGDGSGGNYRLGNREALHRPKPGYECNEEGRVVVRIVVDQSGKVINAEPGVKGSTNTDPCLIEKAREAALQTRFNEDSYAPTRQVGEIIYNFSLSE